MCSIMGVKGTVHKHTSYISSRRWPTRRRISMPTAHTHTHTQHGEFWIADFFLGYFCILFQIGAKINRTVWDALVRQAAGVWESVRQTRWRPNVTQSPPCRPHSFFLLHLWMGRNNNNKKIVQMVWKRQHHVFQLPWRRRRHSVKRD